jgi:hypothetical protein
MPHITINTCTYSPHHSHAYQKNDLQHSCICIASFSNRIFLLKRVRAIVEVVKQHGQATAHVCSTTLDADPVSKIHALLLQILHPALYRLSDALSPDFHAEHSSALGKDKFNHRKYTPRLRRRSHCPLRPRPYSGRPVRFRRDRRRR